MNYGNSKNHPQVPHEHIWTDGIRK